MFDEIKQSVDVSESPKVVGLDRWIGRRVTWKQRYKGTIESCFLLEGYIMFIILLDDGTVRHAYMGEVTVNAPGSN